jgi:hypothetical protein
MPYKDPIVHKEKHKEYSRKHYEKTKDATKTRTAKQSRTGKDKWDAFKSSLHCARCPQNHIAALDFHHINPEDKEYSVSKLISSKMFTKAYKEIKKCIVLCANCHRIHHYEENSAKMQALTTNQLPEHAGQR